jgi:CubicO group peptidase (beta-lactamase class C family)
MFKTVLNHRTFILWIGFLLCSAISSAQSAQPAYRESLLIHTVDSILNSEISHDKIPGAVIEIKKDGLVVYKHAYGYAQRFSYDHQPLANPEKMTTDHLFDIASLTKVVGTTTAIMLLVDRGLIKVDDPVSKYIPAFAEPAKSVITIRNLLTHTAGLYEWYPLYYRAANKQETFKLIGQLPLAFPVGAQRKYSDLGFTILGEIVEVVSGIPLDRFDEENIFKPLGMLHTLYNPLNKNHNYPVAATSFGNPYEHRMVYDPSLGFVFKEINPTAWNGWRHYVLRGEVNDGNAWYANGGVSGAAGLFATADDIQKLVDMLMNRGIVDGKPFISQKTIEEFLTKDRFRNGLGWMMDPANPVIKNGPEGTFGHTGFTGTSIAVVPKQKLSVILLINRQQMGLINNNKEYYNVSPIREQIFKAAIAFCEPR